MRKEILSGVLAAVCIGVVANGLASWREIAVISNKVEALESDTKETKTNLNDIRKMVRDIHWHLIESKEKK